MENRYNIEIIRERAIKPIPLCCKELGQPFLNKRVSEYINRLQLYDFQFEDEEFDVLIKRYPQCRSALRWWCNDWNGNHVKNWGYSMFNINYNRFLKEFLIQNPPQFRISAKCCDYAKKKVGKSTMKKYKIGLSIIGVRKAEGGVRSAAYSGCFDIKNSHHNYDNYRPLFWFTDADKAYYEEKFQIVHSDCYTKWGFTRTGCVGCPYNRKVDEELNTILQYEPKLYKAINNVFNDSYAYTKEYKEFVHKMKRKEWNKKHGRKRLF